ncbi:hypothetical protein C1M51_00980 [Methylibium sp. Pch-M]|uniref:DUF1501 domain-containing protein n=1 Tax=Methylibium sp. Pch-M TaxID=2082386 RepID=UPI0010109543|nr:DUF1501 domain-containing protein [Methylibium sp. Pch-M]QAZ38110.1 hypothetical protein C1M51_00980 [Methylibium sp. Pch-M]
MSASSHTPARGAALTRRALLQAGLGGLVLPTPFAAMAQQPAVVPASERRRILVVLEMSGGNDGLNTVVPYADDTYYRLRPKLGIPAQRLRRIDDHHGFNPGLAGFERLYKDGRLAIVHGCGYDNPNFSHFSSMAYWHTAAPNSGEEYGWVGRLADAMRPDGASNFIVNIDATQSLAVRSRRHVPVVFDDPEKFVREGFFEERGLLDRVEPSEASDSGNRRYLRDIARSARDASELVRQAWSKYSTPVDYGVLPVDLPKVASLIAAGLPTQLYYVAYRNNAFDTHVHQADLHQRLLTYVSDGVLAFMRDMERIGRADDVVLMAFSEFGRRVPENTSLGTDHGTAGPMFIVGKPVKGGQYGRPVSLTERTPDDNLRHTTDFRRTYATVMDGWFGRTDTQAVLRGRFESFPLFA